MSRELREGLAFLQAVALAMHFLRRIDLDLEDAEALGLPALLERLMVGEPVSHASWQAVARLVRVLRAAAEDADDPCALLLQELHREVMRSVDRTAALARQGEPDHGDDDDTEV